MNNNLLEKLNIRFCALLIVLKQKGILNQTDIDFIYGDIPIVKWIKKIQEAENDKQRNVN